MAKTFEEISVEFEAVNAEFKKNKEERAVLQAKWDEWVIRRNAIKEKRTELMILLQSAKIEGKTAKREAKLKELIEAKKAASDLSQKFEKTAPMAAAAHREVPDIDPLAGDLSENVDLDIF